MYLQSIPLLMVHCLDGRVLGPLIDKGSERASGREWLSQYRPCIGKNLIRYGISWRVEVDERQEGHWTRTEQEEQEGEDMRDGEGQNSCLIEHEHKICGEISRWWTKRSRKKETTSSSPICHRSAVCLSVLRDELYASVTFLGCALSNWSSLPSFLRQLKCTHNFLFTHAHKQRVKVEGPSVHFVQMPILLSLAFPPSSTSDQLATAHFMRSQLHSMARICPHVNKDYNGGWEGFVDILFIYLLYRQQPVNESLPHRPLPSLLCCCNTIIK